MVLAARGQEGVDAATDELRALGAGAGGAVADVTNPDAVELLVQSALAHFGEVDILINNAGAYKAARFQDYTPRAQRG